MNCLTRSTVSGLQYFVKTIFLATISRKNAFRFLPISLWLILKLMSKADIVAREFVHTESSSLR